MREILFRGKTRKGKWVMGALSHLNEPCFIRDETANGDEILVHPITIGQYTGLKDKNGTKIFEGDIVKYGDTVHKVVFEQRYSTAYFGMVIAENETLPFGYYQDLLQIEILGNIHDNPELLESRVG